MLLLLLWVLLVKMLLLLQLRLGRVFRLNLAGTLLHVSPYHGVLALHLRGRGVTAAGRHRVVNVVGRQVLSVPHAVLLRIVVAHELQAGRQLRVERDLVHPVLHLLLVGRQEQELRTVGALESEHIFPFRVVLCFVASRVEDVDRRGGCFAQLEVFRVLEEAQQLPAKN